MKQDIFNKCMRLNINDLEFDDIPTRHFNEDLEKVTEVDSLEFNNDLEFEAPEDDELELDDIAVIDTDLTKSDEDKATTNEYVGKYVVVCPICLNPLFSDHSHGEIHCPVCDEDVEVEDAVGKIVDPKESEDNKTPETSTEVDEKSDLEFDDEGKEFSTDDEITKTTEESLNKSKVNESREFNEGNKYVDEIPSECKSAWDKFKSENPELFNKHDWSAIDLNLPMELSGEFKCQVGSDHRDDPEDRVYLSDNGTYKIKLDESFNEDLSDGAQYYGLFKKGGSIGSNSTGYNNQWGQLYAVYDKDHIEDAKERAKRLRKFLTPGEKSYYGMGYVVKPLYKYDLDNEEVKNLIDNKLNESCDDKNEDSKEKVKNSSNKNLKESLSTEEVIEDSYNHFYNDLGRTPSVDDILNDITNNYEGYKDIQDTPESTAKWYDTILNELINQKLEYTENKSKDTGEILNENVNISICPQGSVTVTSEEAGATVEVAPKCDGDECNEPDDENTEKVDEPLTNSDEIVDDIEDFDSDSFDSQVTDTFADIYDDENIKYESTKVKLDKNSNIVVEGLVRSGKLSKNVKFLCNQSKSGLKNFKLEGISYLDGDLMTECIYNKSNKSLKVESLNYKFTDKNTGTIYESNKK